MKILIILTSLSLFQCQGQKSQMKYENLIIGKWEEVSRENKGTGSNLSIPPTSREIAEPTETNESTYLLFQENGLVARFYGDIKEGELSFTIKKDSLFFIEDYKIIQLTDSIMVLKEKAFFKGEFILNTYKKVRE